VGLVSDANGDRFDDGDIGKGDMFYAAEAHLKIAPRTAAAPYSKVTVWHNDGTKDGAVSNGMLGPSGWGYFLVHQQELTNDGRAIGVLRYGKSFDDSALYEQQGGVHFLYDEPRMIGSIEHDMVGLALNWAETSIAGSRDEYNFETFYRLPIFPDMDATFSYQYVIDPALTRDIDNSHLFSLRLRTIF
jgi:carbohydrate-selective porin OprB